MIGNRSARRLPGGGVSWLPMIVVPVVVRTRVSWGKFRCPEQLDSQQSDW